MLPDDVGKILAPILPFAIPTRTPGPSPFKPSSTPAAGLGDPTNPSPPKRRLLKQQQAQALASDTTKETAKDGTSSGEDEEEGGPIVTHEFSHLSDKLQRRAAGLLRMHVLGSVRSRIEVCLCVWVGGGV